MKVSQILRISFF